MAVDLNKALGSHTHSTVSGGTLLGSSATSTITAGSGISTGTYYVPNTGAMSANWAISDGTVQSKIATSEDIKKVTDRLDKIEKRFCIISDVDLEKIENFPALKEAYEHYKLIEKLIEGQPVEHDK